MKLQNAVGAVGQQIEGLTGKVGIIVTKYRERRDGLSQLAYSIQQEIGQVGKPWTQRCVLLSKRFCESCLPGFLPRTAGARFTQPQGEKYAFRAVGLPEFAL